MHPHCSLLKKYICNNKKTNATFESKNYQLGDVGVKWIGVVLFWLLAAGRIAEGGGCFVTGQRERESRMSRLVLMNPEEWAVRGGGKRELAKVLLQSITRKMDRITTSSSFLPSDSCSQQNGADPSCPTELHDPFPLGIDTSALFDPGSILSAPHKKKEKRDVVDAGPAIVYYSQSCERDISRRAKKKKKRGQYCTDLFNKNFLSDWIDVFLSFFLFRFISANARRRIQPRHFSRISCAADVGRWR